MKNNEIKISLYIKLKIHNIFYSKYFIDLLVTIFKIKN